MNYLDKKLLQAIEDGHLETVLDLLREGADPNAIDDEGEPLIFSALCEVTSVIQSRNSENRPKSSYHIEFSIPIADALLSAGANPDVRNGFGHTPLTTAAQWKNIPFAELLLDNHADVNFPDHVGRTALVNAVLYGGSYAEAFEQQEMMIRFLVERGANINAQARGGDTAILWAVFNSKPPMVKLLLDLGADPTLTSDSNNSPLDYAEKLENPVNKEKIMRWLNAKLKSSTE